MVDKIESKSLSDIKYSLEIDEEGYPVFSGLRVHDEEVLNDIFQNLQRALPDEPRSKIVCCMEGHKWAWVDAFDVVLVAQSVDFPEDFSSESASVQLNFLGDISFNVKFEDLSIDEWDRIHMYVGPQGFPAVLSRKAQASFLNFIADNYESEIIFPEHRSVVARDGRLPSESDYWSKAYNEDGGKWDLGEGHPKLQSSICALAEKNSWSKDSKVIVPGAGRGQDVITLAEHSSVVALDFAVEAKAEFESLHSKNPHFKNVDYVLADVFQYFKTLESGSVDAVFEHTFFCAIDPAMRSAYVSEVKRVLKPGVGVWFGIFFLLEDPMGPPFAVTQWELREFSRRKPELDIIDWERIEEGPSRRRKKELWAVMQAK